MSVELLDREVESAVEGRLGIITLHRPKALNALNLAMVEQLDAILSAWERDPDVEAVLIRSAVERAFCAGGDVRSIGILPDADEREALARAFFGTEYRVNHRINRFPKPFIALINGIAMGGGLGLSIHGSHRIVSETVRMAMPETVLGLFPDVGGTWFLHRCPGAVGRYLALIGPQVGAADALAAGLATHHVPMASFAALTADLTAAPTIDEAVVEAVIARHAATPEGGTLAARLDTIDRLFGADDLETLVETVRAATTEADWIADAAAVLDRASPTSLKATWRRMTEGAGQSIERVLRDDFRMAVRIVRGHDFVEGVRAILVDKDHAPRWDPAHIADVDDARIDALLAPLDDEDDRLFA
jgi:enoyl-CoA hydratase